MPRTATAVSIAPKAEAAGPIVVRTSGNVRVLSAAFLGDLQRHYEERGYRVLDYILENEPLAYFQALVGLSKVVRIDADITTRQAEKPKSMEEILARVEAETGKAGRVAFERFLKATERSDAQ